MKRIEAIGFGRFEQLHVLPSSPWSLDYPIQIVGPLIRTSMRARIRYRRYGGRESAKLLITIQLNRLGFTNPRGMIRVPRSAAKIISARLSCLMVSQGI